MQNHIKSLEALTTRDWNMELIFLYHYYFGSKDSFQKAADYLKKKAELTNYDLKSYIHYTISAQGRRN